MNRQRKGKKAMDEGKVGHTRCGMTHRACPSARPERVAALQGVPGWSWAPRAATWGEALAELEGHVAAHGQLPPKRHPSGIGNWIADQRSAKAATDRGDRSRGKRVTPERVAALEAVPGWTWDARRKRAAAGGAHAPPATRRRAAPPAPPARRHRR
jgi:hypothetical protein